MRAAMQISDELHKVKVSEGYCTTDCAALESRDKQLTAQLDHADRAAAQTSLSCQALKSKADDAAARAQIAAQNSVSCTTTTVGATTFTNCD